MAYCPICFNHSLNLKPKGTLEALVNNKQMDTGRLLYNLDAPREHLRKALESKVDEFIKWYSALKNADPIKHFDIISADFVCESGCKLPFNLKPTVVENGVISSKELKNIILDHCQKYGVEINLH